MDDMGLSCMALSDFHSANTYIKEALRMRVKALGDHQETARSYHDYGTVLKAQERYSEALKAFRDALSIQDNILGAHHETIRSHYEISNVLKMLGRLEEANDESKLAELKKKALENEEK
jgi:tetratricopeptide (TPR) repeat protein